jgi:hypothetical protein
MLTSLILVSLTATTLLLIAAAAEEALRLSRTTSARGAQEAAPDVARAPEAAGTAPRGADSLPAPAVRGALQAALRPFPQRSRVQPRNGRPTGHDHIPDQAA